MYIGIKSELLFSLVDRSHSFIDDCADVFIRKLKPISEQLDHILFNALTDFNNIKVSKIDKSVSNFELGKKYELARTVYLLAELKLKLELYSNDECKKTLEKAKQLAESFLLELPEFFK